MTTTTTTATSPSFILSVVEWDTHENYINEDHNKKGEEERIELSKIRLENGSLSHLLKRIRQELIHHVAVTKDALLFFVEISIYDSTTKNHQILYSGEMSTGALNPASPPPQQQLEELVEQDEEEEDLTQRYGRRWRLRVVSMKEKRHEQNQQQQQQKPLLAIQGRSYHESVVIAGKTLYIQERWNDQSNHTAFTVWDASLVLAQFLEENHHQLLVGKNVLELGAGCGVAGMAAACCGAEHVILTDRQEIIPHLQANVDANHQALCDSTTIKPSSLPTGIVTCQTLDWFQPSLSSPLSWRNGGNVDVVLVADCVWTVDLVEPLLNTLQVLTESPWDTPITQSQSENSHVESLNDGKGEHLNNSNGNNQNHVIVLIAYQRRGLSTHEAFWKGLYHLFQVETLLSPSLLNDRSTNSTTVVCSSSKIELYKCTRKW